MADAGADNSNFRAQYTNQPNMHSARISGWPNNSEMEVYRFYPEFQEWLQLYICLFTAGNPSVNISLPVLYIPSAYGTHVMLKKHWRGFAYFSASCKNKFKWSWLEEKDGHEDFLSNYMWRGTSPGVAVCIIFNDSLKYSSSRKEIFWLS